MTAYADKRRHERVSTDIHVHWGRAYDCPDLGRVLSLSVGGCFLRTGEALPAGAEVFVHLWLPGSGALPGEVRYSVEGYGLGVEFKLLGPVVAAQLANLVELYSRAAAR